MPGYQYYTPTVDVPMSDGPLFGRYRRPEGVTLLKELDGTYRTVQVPSEDDLSAAARVYLGGHVHLVSDQEAAELTAAGFGEGLVFVP